MPLQPREGAIARCGRGCLGIILKDEKETVQYVGGTSGEAYVGMHLGGIPQLDGKPTGHKEVYPGNPWSSRNPIVIGYVGGVEDAFKLLYKGMPKVSVEDELRDLVKHRELLAPGWEEEFVAGMELRLKGAEGFTDPMKKKIRELWDRHLKGKSFTS